MNKPPAHEHDKPETVVDRLVRIETRLVKIMEALNLDPKTGAPTRKSRPTNPFNRRPHDARDE